MWRVVFSFVFHTTVPFPSLCNRLFYCFSRSRSPSLFFSSVFSFLKHKPFSLSSLTHLRFLQIQPIPSSPGITFCLFSFISLFNCVYLWWNPSSALYAIPTGTIRRFLIQSTRFYWCSCVFDCAVFFFSFWWIMGVENFMGFWICVLIFYWSVWIWCFG